MTNNLHEILNLISYPAFGLFFIFFILSFFWKKVYLTLSLKAYHSKQRLHQDEVPRIGGLIMYLFLTLLAFFVLDSELLNIILISAAPIIFIGAKEDLFHNTSPKLRLIFMILSATLFIYLLPTRLPEIDFPPLNQILSFSILKEIFFIFSILVIINGNNLIDGVNGNMTLTNIVQLAVLALLAFIMGDIYIADLCVILLIPLIIFLMFNFPFGKIFSGDAGAYFFGFAVSATTIYLFGKYNQLLSWCAVLILIYPSIELLYSFIRKKFYEGKSVFAADAKHLHSLIFRYINKQNSINCNNSMVTFYLLPFIAAPLLTYFIHEDIFVILIVIFVLFAIYNLMYLYLLNKLSK